MKRFVAATLIGMASVAAFAQVQVTPAQVQVTAPKVAVPQVQVTTAQAQTVSPEAPMQGAAMEPEHNAGDSGVAQARHKHHHHHHRKAAMESDAQK